MIGRSHTCIGFSIVFSRPICKQRSKGMILAIDIGNTTVALAGVEDGPGGQRVKFTARMNTVPTRPAEEYLDEMKSIFAARFIPESAFTGAALVSVVPQLDGALLAAARAVTGKEPLYVTKDSLRTLKLTLPSADKIGRDRLVDASWAAATLPLPAITVDMGTATTFNVISRNGEFLGGIIAPGLATGLNALSDRAAQLPPIRIGTPGKTIGVNTEECMLIGSVTGAAAMIEGLAARLEEEVGQHCSLALTGGLARYVHPLIRCEHVYDPDLLLKGLAKLYHENCGEIKAQR